MSLLACFQPLVIGLIVMLGVGRFTPMGAHSAFTGGVRNNTTAFRFFECATYSRLGSQLHYNVQVFSICLAFLLYDVDLFFFLAEAVHLDSNSLYEVALLGVFILLFIFGV